MNCVMNTSHLLSIFIQSAIQDVDYENELDLLYAVVTLHDPSREGSMAASLFFVHDKTGDLLKKVPLPTWKPVSYYNIITVRILEKLYKTYNDL